MKLEQRREVIETTLSPMAGNFSGERTFCPGPVHYYADGIEVAKERFDELWEADRGDS